MTRRRTPLLVAVLVTTATLTAVTQTAAAQERTGQGPTPNEQAGLDGTVTLVTGDQVTVRGGRPQVRPGQGRADVHFAHHKDERGDLHVVPSDAAASVRDGRLDERLFDVTGLIRAGYDDRSTDVTPLIVTSDGARIAGTNDVRALPTLGGHALTAAKTTEFWSGIRAGAAKVWLDGPVYPTLDRSVPRIGAPDAWQAGHTGRGATVAVLDTGIDASHPDLADAITETRNFTDSDTTDDRVGHGTHVAAIVTGTGRYQGVAPDSRLLVGKVLDDYGGGRESRIIAGMEWAAAKADVVNLSLGSPWPSDGSDPLSQAVDRLTADTGALFVVAAGNTGPSDHSVGSPAAADAALTVGAVDRDDNLARFSARGPRRLDNAIKPDITAPGVGIVAAKARNGTIGDPVGDAHVAISGTSMAAPHVAGAAAILAAQHPDWTAAQLKGALVASARPNPALSVYEQGTGRVDVARAARQAVHASPSSLSLGTALWPHHDDAPIERKVVYRNDGTRPLTLAVAPDVKDPAGNPAPAGTVTVTPAEITIAPGTSAEVVVSVKTSSGGPDGVYSGLLVATGDDTVVRTPIGVTKEVESYDVKLSFLDHAGVLTPDYSYRFVSTSVPQAYLPYDPSGVVRTRLPKGTYYFDATMQSEERVTSFGEPDITVSGPAEFVFDARVGVPVAVGVDQPQAKVGSAYTSFEMKTDWGVTGSGHISPSFDDFLYVPSKTTAPARATFSVLGRLARPDGNRGFVGSPYQYSVSWTVHGGIPSSLERRFADRDLAKVESRASASGAGQYGFRDDMAGGPLPLRLTEYYTPDTDWYGSFYQTAKPNAFLSDAYQETAAGRRFRLGWNGVERWNVAPFGPAFPAGARPEQWAGRAGDQLRVSVPLFTDQDPKHAGFSQVVKARTTLHRDGVPLVDTPDAGWLRTTVPAGRGSFRLHTEAERAGVAELSTSVSATWTFSSDTVPGDRAKGVPLSAVRFAPKLDDRNRAVAGRPFAFPVYVQRNASAEVGPVRTAVQVSYDDGVTWKPAAVVKIGERWVAAVSHPAGAKYVSLRATAKDRDGNTVEQTVIRAYGLK